MGRYQSEARDEFFRATGGLAKELAFRWGGNLNLMPNGEIWYRNSRLREPDPDKPATYHDDGSIKTHEGDRAIRSLLGKFVNKNLLLINGEGFNHGSGEQSEQTSLRSMGARWALQKPARAILTVPVPALESANVDLDSIKPIDIQRDRWVDDFAKIDRIPDIINDEDVRKNFTCTFSGKALPQGEFPEGWPFEDADHRQRNLTMVWEGRWDGHRWRIQHAWQGYRDRGYVIARCEVWTTPAFAEPGWTGVQRFTITNRPRNNTDDATRGGEEPGRFIQYNQEHWGAVDPNIPSSELQTNRPAYGRPLLDGQDTMSYGALAQIHRLGNSVFSASGADGKRHRWISAFDEQERQPMYFLAQLPDRKSCKTYQEAIDLLAPDIVHQARADGRHVVRQGDVFAIATEQTTERVYRRGIARVRRDIVLQRQEAAYRPPGRDRDYTEPDAGEVHVVDACPTCGHHGIRTGSGPRARAALSIFGTGHTATEVVVCKKGVTFVRGILYHDPQIEDPQRRAEHQVFHLFTAEVSEEYQRTPITRELMNEHPEKFPWYLAVRNTVPRQRTRRATAAHAPEGEAPVAVARNPQREGRRAA